MQTPASAIGMFIVAALLGAIGQFLYKAGADAVTGGLFGYVTSGRILLGVGCYLGVMVLFVAAFRIGGQPVVLYPIYASTFIWAALIGFMVYATPIRPVHLAGMALLIVGMYLMGR